MQPQQVRQHHGRYTAVHQKGGPPKQTRVVPRQHGDCKGKQQEDNRHGPPQFATVTERSFVNLRITGPKSQFVAIVIVANGWYNGGDNEVKKDKEGPVVGVVNIGKEEEEETRKDENDHNEY